MMVTYARIMQEINRFDADIPNGLENYMDFTINKNLVFIDNMQFMNSSLDVMVKNLSDNDSKHWSLKLSDWQLKLVKQKGKGCIHMNTWTVLTYMERSNSHSSLKSKCISKTSYLHALNAWNMFKWIQWVIIIVFIHA